MRKEVEVMKEKFPNAKRFFMNAVIDLPTDEDHNYKNYYSSSYNRIFSILNRKSRLLASESIFL